MKIRKTLMSRSLKTFMCILPGMVFVPVVIAAYALMFGLSIGDLLTSSMIIILYYIPILGFISVARRHFQPVYALYPFVAILVLELLAFIPGLAPLDLLGAGAAWLRETEDTEVLGKTALVILGAILPTLSLLHRMSLFRLVTATMGFAQCATLLLFHIVALSMPFHGLLAQEDQAVRAHLALDGNVAHLCALEGRSCYSGDLEHASDWARDNLPTPGPALSLISDTAEHAPLLHSWVQNPVESPVTGKMDQLSTVTALKMKPDEITLIVSTAGPTLIYDRLRSGIGLLIAIFHAAWIPLGLAILARHGSYDFRQGRWRRAG